MWNVDEAIESCHKIGYPVMLKASWGGGGKGIRKVHNDDEVRQVFKQILGEVRPSGFSAVPVDCCGLTTAARPCYCIAVALLAWVC